MRKITLTREVLLNEVNQEQCSTRELAKIKENNYNERIFFESTVNGSSNTRSNSCHP